MPRSNRRCPRSRCGRSLPGYWSRCGRRGPNRIPFRPGIGGVVYPSTRRSWTTLPSPPMAAPSVESPDGVHRRRLFIGICLALIPTGASFALVSNILIPLKQEFILTNYQVGLIGGAALWGMAISLLVMGPMLEGFGLKNGARMAFAGHVAGITLMLLAASRAGDPSAFWLLMTGAATLAAATA